MNIFTVNNKKEKKFLKQENLDFDFAKFSTRDIAELIKKMRATMIAADGIGLAANQVGLNLRVFVVQIQKKDKRGNQRTLSGEEQKFYAIFNPEIIKKSSETIILEEGCLSVPDAFGMVERPEKITLVGSDKNGKKMKIKAWGLLARVFQHETDHLNGILFIDKAKDIQKVTSKQ